jgi:hypothetical protein
MRARNVARLLCLRSDTCRLQEVAHVSSAAAQPAAWFGDQAHPSRNTQSAHELMPNEGECAARGRGGRFSSLAVSQMQLPRQARTRETECQSWFGGQGVAAHSNALPMLIRHGARPCSSRAEQGLTEPAMTPASEPVLPYDTDENSATGAGLAPFIPPSIEKLINVIMRHGKKEVARRIVFDTSHAMYNAARSANPRPELKQRCKEFVPK